MEKYDLTKKMVPYLDRHLVFPLLEFLSINEAYENKDLLKAKYELLSKTNMVDFTSDLHKQLHATEDVPEELTKKREQVMSTLEELNSKTKKVMEIIENPEVVAALRQDKEHNLRYLKENFQLEPESLSSLYQLGLFQYSCGNYGGCVDNLYHFQILSVDEKMLLSSHWGKLSAEILSGNWESAYADLQKLKDSIESGRNATPLHLLHQRTHLIHWSLFIFFNHAKGRDYILDILLQPQYISTIQTSCPWILRYLSCAAIINRRRKNVVKDLLKILQQESHVYQDPITQFLEALYLSFDFDGAQAKLKECEELFSSDFFLVSHLEDFLESARTLILEAYCRINQRINIGQLSERLNLSPEDGEKWIVNLIRDSRVDAKIDFTDNSVVMNPLNSSIYRQMIEKTRDLVFQTQLVASGIEKRDAALSSTNSTGKGKQTPRRQNQSTRPTTTKA